MGSRLCALSCITEIGHLPVLQKVFQLLAISCRHRKLTKPFAAATQTAVGSDWEPVYSGPGHYVVCLECGKKLGYDWQAMRVIK
jgi:hypothetical protein